MLHFFVVEITFWLWDSFLIHDQEVKNLSLSEKLNPCYGKRSICHGKCNIHPKIVTFDKLRH